VLLGAVRQVRALGFAEPTPAAVARVPLPPSALASPTAVPAAGWKRTPPAPETTTRRRIPLPSVLAADSALPPLRYWQLRQVASLAAGGPVQPR